MKLTKEEIKEYGYEGIELKEGEWMMVCRWCGWRGEKNIVYVNICPTCRKNLMTLSPSEEEE